LVEQRSEPKRPAAKPFVQAVLKQWRYEKSHSEAEKVSNNSQRNSAGFFGLLFGFLVEREEPCGHSAISDFGCCDATNFE
jgi:hypothetical protein